MVSDIAESYTLLTERNDWRINDANHLQTANRNKMDTNDLIIREATDNDAKHIASAFIMGIGEECAKVYCGQNYRSVIEEIAITDGTQYNYQNALIAVWNDTVAGVCIGYDGGKSQKEYPYEAYHF